MAEGGEIFILKMPAIRIGDLAEVIIEESAQNHRTTSDKIEIDVIGSRVGEKLYEELMTEEEAVNAYEDEEMFVVLPQTFDVTGELPYNLPDNFKKAQEREFSSERVKLLTREEIKHLLREVQI